MGKTRTYARRTKTTATAVANNTMKLAIAITIFCSMLYVAGLAASPIIIVSGLGAAVSNIPRDVYWAYGLVAAIILSYRPFAKMANGKKAEANWWMAYGIFIALTLGLTIYMIGSDKFAWTIGGAVLYAAVRLARLWKKSGGANKVDVLLATTTTTETEPQIIEHTELMDEFEPKPDPVFQVPSPSVGLDIFDRMQRRPEQASA